MDVITSDNKRYVTIQLFMTENSINSEKTVYNWVDSGKAELKKILNKSFFRKAV
jgi:hypothetical protein